MTPEIKKPKIEDVTTPIFDRAMGDRMRMMRMKLLMDQAELAFRFGMAQQTISKIEGGRLSVPRNPFTVTHMKHVFGDLTAFILYGSNPERFNYAHIAKVYHDTKFKIERKPREKGEHWTHRRMREQREKGTS